MSGKHTPNLRSKNAMQRVRKLRRDRGWSQADLADRLDQVGMPIARDTLASYEIGRRRDMTVDELFAFAEALGVSPMALAEPGMCDTCNGAPPAGFECRSCGATTDGEPTQ